MIKMWNMSTLTLFLACLCISRAQEVRVNTSAGIIVGTEKRTVSALNPEEPEEYYEFLGIPYAKPPINGLRFEKPVKRERFETPYYANITTDISCLADGLFVYPWYAKSSFTEDCLYLNIFVPKGKHDTHSSKRPVMVYIHGGSFIVGSQNSFRAPEMAMASGIILVTLNYRLGVLGFLAISGTHMKGNYGLWDQHMAICWINENIEAFGGDKTKVTLFGNSAGAASVLYQAMYPGNKGLIQGVIAESGSPISHFAYTEDPDILYSQLLRDTGCHTITCLKYTNVSNLYKYYYFAKPSVDGEFVRMFPDRLMYAECFKEAKEVIKMFADVNVIIGITSNDGGYIITPGNNKFQNGTTMTETCMQVPLRQAFKKYGDSTVVLNEYLKEYQDLDHLITYTNLSQNVLDIERDVTLMLPATEALQVHSKGGGAGRAYFYVFDHRPAFSSNHHWMAGASHSDELPYVFSFAATIMWDFYKISEQDIQSKLNVNEVEMSKLIVSFWARFAETGNPNLPGESERWPEYQHDTQKHISFKILGDSFTQVHQFFSKERVFFWRRYIADWLRRSTRNKCVITSLRIFPPLPKPTSSVCLSGIESGSSKIHTPPVYICLCLTLCLLVCIYFHQ